MVLVRDIDDDGSAELLFSSRFSCPVCDYALPELEPRLFSFNSPMGACAACDGLGVTRFFDTKRVVANPALSLAAGAVRGWVRRDTHFFHLIVSLARHYGRSEARSLGNACVRKCRSRGAPYIEKKTK